MRPCPEHDILACPMVRVNRVKGNGPVPCSIMLVGEAPGKTEDGRGKPFIGKSGSELDFLYLGKCAQLSRDKVYASNLVKCRTNDKDRDPNMGEIEACTHLLWDELRAVRPRYIGTVGRIATSWFLPDAKMDKMHGVGYAWPEGTGVTIMPLYHPAYGLHNTPMMRHIMGDFERFGRMVRGDASVLWQEKRGLV